MNEIINDNDSKLLNLEKIFENRFFEIPDYQRGYSWEKRQVNDLIEDIERLIQQKDNKYMHFTGTIVASRKKSNQQVLEIIDGQQRLLTLLILINSIYEFNKSKFGYLMSRFLKTGELGKQIYKFTPNNETKDYFFEYVLDANKLAKAELKSHENIRNAKIILNDWIIKNSSRVDDILNIVITRLGFLLFCPENNNEIGIMFEVINNRGKRLSELEKIKNYFIYISTIYDFSELRDTINRNWCEILRNLSVSKQTRNEDENSFLRNCYLVYFEVNKEKSWKVYDQLKDRFDPNESSNEKRNQHFYDIKKFVDFLNNASFFYACFKNNDFFTRLFPETKIEIKLRLGKILKYLRCHPENASILPLYLAITAWIRDNEMLCELLELVEKMNFRVYVLPKITNRADSKQGELFRLANDFYKEFSNKDTEKKYHEKEIEILKKKIVKFTSEQCSEESFVKSLTLDKDEKDNYYNWNGIKYLLGRYEEKIKSDDKRTWDLEGILIKKDSEGSEINDFLSIEHIWARKNRVEKYPEDFLEKRRLGNFILVNLGKNISLQNEDIPVKIDKIKKLIEENKTIDLIQFNDFVINVYPESVKYAKSQVGEDSPEYFEMLSKKINDLRESKLIEFALETWLFKDEKDKIFKEVNSFTNQNQTYFFEQNESNKKLI
jgi:uncharacterized protein with ParB-like and HNH nuclease domain